MIGLQTSFLLLVAFAPSWVGSLVAAEPESIEVLLEARKATWSSKEGWYFDITVKNRSAARIEVPYVYDAVIEIDGALYTQFPKPRVDGNPNRVIPPGAEVKHGTLTLNGNAFSTVDAKTGKLPLKLGAGEYTLQLILGDHPSRRASFKVVD